MLIFPWLLQRHLGESEEFPRSSGSTNCPSNFCSRSSEKAQRTGPCMFASGLNQKPPEQNQSTKEPRGCWLGYNRFRTLEHKAKRQRCKMTSGWEDTQWCKRCPSLSCRIQTRKGSEVWKTASSCSVPRVDKECPECPTCHLRPAEGQGIPLCPRPCLLLGQMGQPWPRRVWGTGWSAVSSVNHSLKTDSFHTVCLEKYPVQGSSSLPVFFVLNSN